MPVFARRKTNSSVFFWRLEILSYIFVLSYNSYLYFPMNEFFPTAQTKQKQVPVKTSEPENKKGFALS